MADYARREPASNEGPLMDSRQLLNVIERLWKAAQHPDVTHVHQYDGALHGVAVVYTSDAKAFFTIIPGKPTTQPAAMPDDLGPWKVRTRHALQFLLDLLDLAQPAGLRWRTVAVDGVHLAPSAVEFNTGGQSVVVAVTAGGPSGIDSNPDDWADYTIPEEVRTCLQGANAPSAVHV